MWRKIAALIVFALAAGPIASAQASSLPSGFTDTMFVTNTISEPTAMAFAPDGRLFVLSQSGSVRIIKNGALLPTPFLTLTVNHPTGSERGLLGITFDPDFTTNHFVYLYYTSPTPTIHNRVSRFTDTNDIGGTEQVLLDLPTLGATNHNGGSLHFGSDNELYIAVGDNALNGPSDPHVSQMLSTPLGKILRINADGSLPTNPFSATPGADPTVWALGLRNPFTFAFDAGGSHQMFINDVGQNTFEEIDPGTEGANYGWPNTEGKFVQSQHPDFTEPVYTYTHNPECAITGGEFYRPPAPLFPSSYEGKYFFSDLCGGWIKMMNPSTDQVTTFASSTAGSVVDLDTGPDGRLYYLSRGDNRVHVISYSNTPPTVHIVRPLSSFTYRVGGSISYSASAADIDQKSIAPGKYSWKVEQIDGSTVTPMPLSHPTGKSGSFHVPVTADKANSTTVTYRLTVTVTDNGGATATDSVEVMPQVVMLTFRSNPMGIDVSLDGVPHTTPFSQQAVVGMPYMLSAPAHAHLMSAVWQFHSWMPGGQMAHAIKAPQKNTNYTANYDRRIVLNGSFENTATPPSHPMSWTIMNLGKNDGRDCVTTPQDGVCSLRMAGGTMTKSVSQIVKLSGLPGDSYTLQFQTQTSGASANGYTVQLIMMNRDHTTSVSTFVLPAGDNPWTAQTLTVPSLLPGKQYIQIQVVIKAKAGASGNVWVDHFMLGTP